MIPRPPAVPPGPSPRVPPPGADMHSRRRMQRFASVALYTGLVLLALWVVRDFIPAVAWACVIATSLWPLFRKLERQPGLNGRTTIIATLLTIVIALLLVLPVGIGIAQAAAEAHDLAIWLHSVEQNGVPIPDFIANLPFGSEPVTHWWNTNLGQPLKASPAMKGLHGHEVVMFGRNFGIRAVHALMVFAFTLVTLFVIFQAGPSLSGAVLKGMRRAFGAESAQLAERMAAAVRGTVSGLVVVGIGEGVLLGIAYAVTGVPHATLLGLITAIAAMLPFCAPIVFCGAGLWLFLQGGTAGAIGLVVFGFAVVFIAEHFVRPVLIGNSTRLPFLLVLFGILGGAETFGLLGVFIGPALMTILMVLWTDFVR
ncbi:AI-2E family transporter [Paraburkholderia humisilvae]|uniref:Transport protein YdiK n=1 Tax=Paraburkholderia humisilvae TaxID=627669 RepID=A0A6J5DCF4_9BURK|nr:AI-2E family transporter [Paraburkholderia humisilvae]CAB3751930.1 Putative transport protein YdiK [Paraburkholderia humisilvae]